MYRIRKRLLVALLFFSVSAHIFPQEGPENVFAINIGYLIPNFEYDSDIGLGLWFERYITDYFTIGANFDIRYTKYNPDTSAFLIGLAPNWRFYPFAEATKGFFTYLETGYTLVLYKTINADITGHIFNLNPGIGYKFIFAEIFMLEPRVGYNLAFAFIDLENDQYFGSDVEGFDANNITWGLVFGLGF
jgi:hypothetical protein